MKKILFSITSIILIICLFSSCGGNRIVDIVTTAEAVLINGKAVDTVEASMGAFEGKQGDYIEFRFSEEQTFNTVFINENIAIEETTATALKIEIVNTEIGNDHFIIQGISAYQIEQK